MTEQQLVQAIRVCRGCCYNMGWEHRHVCILMLSELYATAEVGCCEAKVLENCSSFGLNLQPVLVLPSPIAA